jgi:CRISPR-associated protein (TIGR02710 family)
MIESSPPVGASIPEQQRPLLLLATVGGSPRPIITAMETLRPAAVFFVVSDGTANQKSSLEQVDSEQIVIDAANAEKGPGLRHQPACPRQVKIYRTPADDPDRAFEICRAAMLDAMRDFPDHRYVADYTGGTKSMTAGMLMAALAVEGVEAQFMSGHRKDLIQVAAGTETPSVISAEAILIDREMQRIGGLMQTFDYPAALVLAEKLQSRAKQARSVLSLTRRRIAQTRTILQILAEWDAFRHAEAAKKARTDFENGGGAANFLKQAGLYAPLQDLAKSGRSQSNWLICADLWLNANRCAVRRRYDDAIARLYRLTEAAVQAQLWEKYQLPNPLPREKVPSDLCSGASELEGRDANGRKYPAIGIGLDRSIQLLLRLNGEDPLSAAMRRGGASSGRPPWTSKRNKSILAHGFSSLNETAWKEASNWVAAHLRGFWSAVEPPQMPRHLPK